MNTLPVNENYLKHYHLSHDPFAARVPNFKFFPAQRKTILGQLHHLARHSTLMLVVTGPENSGKTLLRQALIASVNKVSVKIVNVSEEDSENTRDFLALLVRELQAPSHDLSDIIEQINKLKEQDVDFYLMIDDADQLTDGVLQILLNLASEQLAGLHIFLFARSGLLDRIEKSALAKEVTFNLPLTPYSLEETVDYLSSRLEGAEQKLSLFTEEEINTIYTKSGGWPGAINEVARELLLSRLEEKPEPIISTASFSAVFDNELNREPALFALNDDEFEDEIQTKPKFKLPKKHLIIAAIIAIVLILILLFSNSSKTEQVTEAGNGQAIDLSNNASTQTVSIPLDDTAQPPVDNTPMDTLSSVPQPDIPVENNVSHTDSTGQPIVPVAPVSESSAIETSVDTVSNTVPSVVSSENITSKKVESQEKPPVVTKKEEPKTTSSPVKNTITGGNAWYSSQNGSHFTIQVSVASSENLAKDFLKKNAGSYQYFKRSRAGRVDYVITSGSYASRTAAQNAIKALPLAVQSSKPWIRSFASIKQELVK